MPVFDVKEKEYQQICKELGVKILIAGPDNKYYKNYQQRMTALGGHVVSHREFKHSSTKLMEALNPNLVRHPFETVEGLTERANVWDKKAKERGYLKDYLEETNKRIKILG